MKRIIVSVIILCCLACPVFPADKNEDKNAGIFYGENYCYAIAAPNGWVMDTKSGKKLGLQAVFYKAGSTWDDAESVIYINASQKEGNITVDSIVKDDIATFKKGNKNFKVDDAPPLKVDGKDIITKYFRGDKVNNSEAVGYLDEDKVVILFVLSSKSEKGFKDDLAAFKEFLQTYFRMKLEIDKDAKTGDSIILDRNAEDQIKSSGDRDLKIK